MPELRLAANEPESYAAGTVAVVRAAPAEARQLGKVPAGSVAGFVYTGGPIVLSDLFDRGVRFTGLAGVELQGWLRATGSDRYQIAADLRIGFGKGAISELPCLFTAWLEDQSIGDARQSVSPWDNRQGAASVSLVSAPRCSPGSRSCGSWSLVPHLRLCSDWKWSCS